MATNGIKAVERAIEAARAEKDPIVRAFHGLRRERTGEVPSAWTWFRASLLGDFCPLRYYVMAQNRIEDSEVVGPGLSQVFEIGTWLHRALRDSWLAGEKEFVGLWRCLACGALISGDGPRWRDRLVSFPETCLSCRANLAPTEHTCGVPRATYQEIRFESRDLLIYGHADGFIRDADGLSVLEFKTANPYRVGEFRDGRLPRRYEVQIQVMLHLTGIERAVFVALDKAGYGDRFSDFYFVTEVQRSEAAFDYYVRWPIEAYRTAVECGEPPDVALCLTEKQREVAKCPVKRLCRQYWRPDMEPYPMNEEV